MRQQETLGKENFWLRDKISKLSTKISTKVSTQNADLSSNQTQVKRQRETFQVTKNAIDVDCDEILREMLSDYTRNEQILKSNIAHLGSEISAKKSTIKSIKSQFQSLGSTLRSQLHSTSSEIRQDSTSKHCDRQQNLTLSLTSNQTQISDLQNINTSLSSQITNQKLHNKRKFELFSDQSRNIRASKDSALNEFKSIELKIKQWSEKYQMTQEKVFKGQECYDNLGRLKDERDMEYGYLWQGLLQENEGELREGELVVQEVDRHGEELLERYGELLEEAEGLRARREAVMKDVESGMELTLHNVVCDY